MSCNIQIKTINHMKDKGLMEDNRNVPANVREAFDAENERLTEYAKTDKGVDMGPLFTIENKEIKRSGRQGTVIINRAVPNIPAFEAIQKFNDENGGRSKKNDQTFEKRLEEQQDSKPERKGFNFDITKQSTISEDIDSQEELQNQVDILSKLFDNTDEPTTANKFLRDLYVNPDISINEEGKRLIKAMLSTRSKIKFVDSTKMQSGEKSYAQYNTENNTISINTDVMGKGNLYYAIESILHEIAHDRFHVALNQPKTDSQRQFRDSMVSIFNYYNRNVQEIDGSSRDDYGFTDVNEFVSEILTNRTFRERLKSIEGKSLWRSIIDAIKSFFGLQTSPKVDSLVNSIIDFAETEYSENTESELNTIFNKKISSKEEIKADLKEELTNVNDILTRIYTTIEAVKNKSKNKKGDEYKKKYEKLQKDINKYKKVSSKKAILEFLDFSSNEIKSLSNSLQNKKNSATLDYLNRFKSYMTIFSNNEEIKSVIYNLREFGEISKEEFDKMDDIIDSISKEYNALSLDIKNLSTDLLVEQMSPYNREVYEEYLDGFRREYRKLKPSGITEEKYITDKFNDNIDTIQADSKARLRKGFKIVNKDISGMDYNLFTEKDIDATVLNIMSQKLDIIDSIVREYAVNKRNEIATVVRKFDFKENSNKDKYSFMLDLTDNNNYYISKYKGEFNDIIEGYRDRLSELEKGSKEYKNERLKYRKWLAQNYKNNKPIDKWLNPKFSAMSSTQKEFYDVVINQIKENDKLTNGIKSLINKPFDKGPTFIKMHGITQSNADKILSGQVFNSIKTSTQDLFKNRKDEEEYGDLGEQDDLYERIQTDLNNKAVNSVPVFYRSMVDKKDQSFDIPTMIAMEASMAKNYQQKKEYEAEADLLLFVIGKTEFRKRNLYGKAFINWFKKDANITDADIVKIQGTESNLYAKMKSVMENRLYGITDIYAGKIFYGKASINKVASSIAAYTADLQLGLNVLTAIPNLLQAKLQNFIEGAGGGIYTLKDMTKAESIYMSEMGNILDDIGSVTYKSKVNMLIEMHDLFGDFGIIKNDFEIRSKLRSLADKSTIHAFNHMGEHYAQASLMLSVMNATKVKNKDGNFIDKEGNVVTKDKAMTLYDAYEKVENKDGTFRLELNKNAYTTNNSIEPLSSNLGKVQHQQLIKKISIKLHGQYDTKHQSHFQRSWYGKLFFMFRKWMLTSYQRRYKGILFANKKYEDLSREQKFFDFETGNFDEGIYTSFGRFIINGLFPAIKNFKLELATQNWNEMSDMERRNVTKTIVELSVTLLMFTAATLAYAAAEDDDEEMLFTLAYIFRRQQSEFMQFYDPSENLRVFRSPAVAINTVEKMYQLLSQLLPHNITEEYENGKNKGQLRAWIKTKKMIPIMAQFERSPKELFNFLENSSN